MQLKSLIFCLFLTLGFNSIAQSKYHEYTLKRNSDVVPQNLLDLEGRNIIFFIGNRHNSDKFQEKVLELQKSPTMRLVKDANIHFVFFKESTKNNSEGILIKSDSMLSVDSSIYVNQLEVFFNNYEEKKIARAAKKLKGSFYYEKPFEGQNLYRMNIVDTTSCFPDIPERIPFYRGIIKTLHRPVYSEEEKANLYTDTVSQKLLDSIVALNLNIRNLQEQIENQNNRLNELEKYMTFLREINNKRIDKLEEIKENQLDSNVQESNDIKNVLEINSEDEKGKKGLRIFKNKNQPVENNNLLQGGDESDLPKNKE
tara:strand:+ start:2371 stop:3309 length:939 start_codon:yes stop_codon:yes gene_type:complete